MFLVPGFTLTPVPGKRVLVRGRELAVGLVPPSLAGEADAPSVAYKANFLQTHRFEGRGELINCAEPFHETDCRISPSVSGMNHAYKLLGELWQRHPVLSCLFNFGEGLVIKKGLYF